LMVVLFGHIGVIARLRNASREPDVGLATIQPNLLSNPLKKLRDCLELREVRPTCDYMGIKALLSRVTL